MAKNDNTIIWIIVGLIFIFIVGPKIGVNLFSIFSESNPSGGLYLKTQRGDTAFFEGDNIVIDITGENANADCKYFGDCYSLQGYMTFINDKLLINSGVASPGIHYGICAESYPGWSDQYSAYNYCDTWQFVYRGKFQCSPPGIVGLNSETLWNSCSNVTFHSNYLTGAKLKSGNNQAIEVIAYLRRGSGSYVHRFQTFNINVVPTAFSNNTKIITLTMKNTGGQKLTDITLNPLGTTPSVLYSQFSNLKKFTLNPNDQSVFYANLDTSSFNGQVPFQMMFDTRYSIDGGRTNYTLVKYTEPLLITFLNGEIIP